MGNNFKLDNKNYISMETGKRQEIVNVFCQARSLQLPVLSKEGEVQGILDLFDYLDFEDVSVSLRRNIFILHGNEKLNDYSKLNQEVIPFVGRKGQYLGFLRKSELGKDLELAQIKRKYQASERKRLQSFRELYNDLSTILELSSDGIFITDGQGIVLQMNSACERLDEVDRKDIIGRNVKELVDENVYSESVALEALEKQSITMIQKVKNGKELVSTGTPVFEGDKIKMVIVNARDVTELSNLKNELNKVSRESEKVHQELEELRKQQLSTGDIIFESAAMKRVASMALKVAPVDSTVLLEGESGVGKGVLSKFIHNNSLRKDGPFIKIECSSIPENLLESELFGYVKGAFTGADKSGKVGLVELAHGGTLFLDEIGEVPLPVQVKLLRLIQDKKFIKIGGKKPVEVDIRIIAATNKDLKEMVTQKKFRKDLYYRINVIPLYIPPLRERKEALGTYIMWNLDRINTKYHLDKELDSGVLKKLVDYNWPGNVRELENVMEMLAITSRGRVIEVVDLPSQIAEQETMDGISLMGSFKDIMDSYEKTILLKAMETFSSTEEIAAHMHIDASTVRRKLRKHGIKIAF